MTASRTPTARARCPVSRTPFASAARGRRQRLPHRKLSRRLRLWCAGLLLTIAWALRRFSRHRGVLLPYRQGRVRGRRKLRAARRRLACLCAFSRNGAVAVLPTRNAGVDRTRRRGVSLALLGSLASACSLGDGGGGQDPDPADTSPASGTSEPAAQTTTGLAGLRAGSRKNH